MIAYHYTNGNYLLTIKAEGPTDAEKKARSYFKTVREKKFFDTLHLALPGETLPRQPLTHLGKTR